MNFTQIHPAKLHLWYEKIREDHLSSWNFPVSFGVVSGHGDGPWAMACRGSMSEVDNLVERKLHRIYVYLASWSANGIKWRQELGLSENSVPLNPMVNDHYPY